MVKNPPGQRRGHKRSKSHPWVGKISWRRAWQPTPVFLCGVSLWIGEPDRLHLIELQAIGHDWSDLAHALLHFVLQGQTCHSCFFHDPADVGNLTSGSSAFSKSSLNIWKFMVHILLKSGLENFEHYFTSV